MTREHIDVNKWARVARQVNEGNTPPVERPCPVARHTEPTYNDHAAWELALARPCERHDVDADHPCWCVPRGMCATRTKTLGHVATSQRRGRGTKEAS